MRSSRISSLIVFAIVLAACDQNPLVPGDGAQTQPAAKRHPSVATSHGGNTMGSGHYSSSLESSTLQGGNTLGSGNHQEQTGSESNIASTDSVSLGTSDGRGGNTMGSGN